MRAVVKRSLKGWAMSLALVAAGTAQADTGTWTTDPTVGATALTVTLQVSCPSSSFICSQIDGYSDTQVTTLTGAGQIDVDDVAGTIQFLSDGDVDLGSGVQPVYNRLGGGALTFAYLPFAGIPRLESLQAFTTADTPWSPADWSAWSSGDFPVSVTLPYSIKADVVGDLEFNVPDLSLPPQNVNTAGTWRVLEGLNPEGQIAYQLIGLETTVSHSQAAQILGEPVTLDLTLALASNLSGSAGAPAPVPLLQEWALVSFAIILLGTGALRLRGQKPEVAA